MNSYIILFIIVAYFGILLLIAWITGRKSSSNEAFFLGNRKSPWYIVSIGMVGTSLSGVTSGDGTQHRHDLYADGFRVLFWIYTDCQSVTTTLL